MKQKTQLLEQAGHSPTLRTIVMIESVLKNANQLMSIAEIKQALPRKVMHNTLLQVLDYLQLSGKIIIGTKGILWIFTEQEELEKLKKSGLKV